MKTKLIRLILVLLTAAPLLLMAPGEFATPSPASAQSCTPPLFQGYPSSCTNIHLRWLNRDPIALIDHFDIYRGGLKVGTVLANAVSFSEPVGCGFGAVYTIKQVMKSGASCQTITSGNPPHTKPCNLCDGSGGGGGGGTVGALSAANAASFTANAAPGSIVAAFGNGFTSFTESGFADNLAGVSATVAGTPANLFYASPGQINLLVPNPLPLGDYKIAVTNAAQEQFEGNISLARHAPGVFTKSANGAGLAAADYQYFPGRQPDRVYIVLFATGIGLPPNPTPETLDAYRAMTLFDYGGLLIQPSYVGPSPGLFGVDQINIAVPKDGCNQKRRATITIQGNTSNSFDVQCPPVLNIQP